MAADSLIVKQTSGQSESSYVSEVLVKNAAYVTGGTIDTDHPNLRPGSVAYTADLSYMAMKDLDGSWKQIGG